MKYIYFKGYYGFGNLGDDIFTVTADWICNNKWVQYKPIFIGKNLPQTSNNARKIETKNIFKRRIYEILICLRATNIIYYGGSLFSGGISGHKDLKYYLNKFDFFHKKLGTIGTSIGPFKDSSNFDSTKEFLNKFKYISIRDNSSFEYIDKMNLKDNATFCFDNAILINDVYPNMKKSLKLNKISIGVSLCHYERYNGYDINKEIERENSVLELLEKVVKTNDNISEIVFIVFNGNKINGDLEITEKFNNILKKDINTRIVEYSSETENMIKEINNCDIMLGIRLHSGILSYALDIPFMLIEYHKKCTEFLNTINHKFRFKVNDLNHNISNFNHLIKDKKIPNIIQPNYFRNIMIDELNKIEKKL